MYVDQIAIRDLANFGISLESCLDEIYDLFSQFKDFFGVGMTPKQYGMRRYEKKCNYKTFYQPYHCSQKVQKNFPYQRHIY